MRALRIRNGRSTCPAKLSFKLLLAFAKHMVLARSVQYAVFSVAGSGEIDDLTKRGGCTPCQLFAVVDLAR